MPRKHGKTLLVVLILTSILGCRGKKPPPMGICIGDGFGGCDGVDINGEVVAKTPSELKKNIILVPTEFASYVAYCQGITLEAAQAIVDHAASNPKEAQQAYFQPNPKPSPDATEEAL